MTADDTRSLPPGWTKQWDNNHNQYFYVDTRATPPRSIWTHPLDEPEYKSSQYAPPPGPPPSSSGHRASDRSAPPPYGLDQHQPQMQQQSGGYNSGPGYQQQPYNHGPPPMMQQPMYGQPIGREKVGRKRIGSIEESEKRRSSSESDHSQSTYSTPSTSQMASEKETVIEQKEEEKKKSFGAASKLAPTAAPFIFSPRPIQPATSLSTPPFSRLSPISSASVGPRHGSLPFPATQASFSPLDTPPHSALPRFDSTGSFVDSYSNRGIAEEIQRLQDYRRGEGLGGGNHFDYFSNYDDDDEAGEDWTAQQQQRYNSMFSSPPYSSSERSRSSSIASSSSFFGNSLPSRHSVDRNATVQQLASYFGPSPVDVAPPILPAGFDNFSPQPDLYSPYSSRHGSISSLDSGIYPPLAHPEPFNLTPEDDLYIQARESTRNPVAMNQENPLAALYVVNSEQTKGFYANPATSGLDETVVKVAAMRGRQNQMLSVQRSAAGQILPGPSPNNRKLELYKTELCRSWEEKGSCRYGFRCQFAHGREEQRSNSRHPKFKSELCRTFAINGSCPYGPRCCFIHQALPGAGAGGGTNSVAPSSPPVAAHQPDSPSESVSRRAHLMTSTAVAGAPQRQFGPTLSTYIGSNPPPSSSYNNGSALSSLANSPTTSFRPSFSGASQPQSPDSPSFVDPFGDANVGLGLSLRLGQAPAVHQEPAKSRIHRYSLNSQNSSASLSSPLTGPSSSPATSFHPHDRTLSNNSSFSSFSSGTSSFTPPGLERHGSQSSLSSAGLPSSPLALRPIGIDWLGNQDVHEKSDSFEWSDRRIST
ncbi:Tis11p [Sporobolomyces salmoneus]|uniref:Tis11p n=1 Tax=Sporobolomyces salmoneus TaxID=183962 RepID=UPI00316F1643